MPVNVPGSTSVSPNIMDAMNRELDKHKKIGDMDENQLKGTINNHSLPTRERQYAFDEVMQRLGAKVDDKSASEGETRQHELMQKLKENNISDEDLSELAKSLGADPQKLRELNGGVMTTPSKEDIQ